MVRKTKNLIQEKSKIQEVYLSAVNDFNQSIAECQEFQVIESLARITRDKIIQNLYERSSQDTYFDTINDSVEIQYLVKIASVLQQTISEIVEEYIIHNEIPSSELMAQYLQEIDQKKEDLYNAYYKRDILDPFFGVEQPFQKSEVTEELEKRAKKMYEETEKMLNGEIHE